MTTLPLILSLLGCILIGSAAAEVSNRTPWGLAFWTAETAVVGAVLLLYFTNSLAL